MKRNGFTLIEVLAVIVIIAVLVSIALISVSRYRKDVDDKDLSYLHATLETSYNNYRSDAVSSGDGNYLDEIEVDLNSERYSSFIEDYLKGMSYEGKKINAKELEGSEIKLTTKGSVFATSEYTDSIRNRLRAKFPNISDAELNEKIEEQYVKDATCIVTSTVEGTKIKKTCKVENGKIVPSKDDLVCIKVKYNGNLIVDDSGSSDGIMSVNTLCKYANYGEDSGTTQRSITITAKPQSIKHGSYIASDVDHVTVTGGLSESHRLSNIILTQSITSVGTGKVTPKGANIVDSEGNDVTNKYNITYKPGTLTITKADAICPTITSYNGEYDGSNHYLGVGVNSVGGTVEFSTDGGSSWSTSKPFRTNAGTTNVRVRVKGDSSHETKDCGTSTITVTPKEVVIPFDPEAKVYTGYSQPSGISCPSGSRVGGDMNAINAGTYAQTCDLTSTTNYKWSDGTTSTKSINWKIDKKSAIVTAKPQTITYGEEISKKISDVTVTGLVAGHNVSEITITPSTTNATTNGTINPSNAVVIDSKGAVATNNYAFTYNPGKLVINKAVCNPPTDLQVSNAGIVSWTNSSNASSYEASFEGDYSAIENGANRYTDITSESGSRTVSVRSVCDSTNYLTPSESVSKDVNVYSVTTSSNDESMGTLDSNKYNVISGATYETDENKLYIKVGNTTLKTINATPSENHKFVSWSGESGTIDDDKTITATFEVLGYTVDVVVNNGTVSEPSKQVSAFEDVTFELVPNFEHANATVSCTNDHVGRVINNVLTVKKISSDTTCTVTYSDAGSTVLYTDGTLVMSESTTDRDSNIREHGEIVHEYDPLSNSNAYVFSPIDWDDDAGEYITDTLWSNERLNINKVIVGQNIRPIDTSYWFNGLHNLSNGDLTALDTSETISMNSMFYNAGRSASNFKLTGLNYWDTSNVTVMSSMFAFAGFNATTWNIGSLSSWDTENVTLMDGMFNRAGQNATTWNSIGTLKVYANDISDLFSQSLSANATVNLYVSPNFYDNAFTIASKLNNSKITVNYDCDVDEELVDEIIDTKFSSDSNVVKGRSICNTYYTVRVLVNNGTVTGDSVIDVDRGASTIFTVNPLKGYEGGTVTCTNNQTANANFNDNKLAVRPTSNTKCTVSFEKIKSPFEVGDYISMTPDKSTYTISSDLTGYNSDQTINPSELNVWRVISENNDGTVDLVSEYVSSKNVSFKGARGYQNFVGSLQTIAAQYAKSGYTVGTRMMGYDGQTLTISNTSAFDGSTTNPPSETTTPSPTEGTGQEYSGGVLGDTLYLKDYQLVQNAYQQDNNEVNYCDTGLCAYKAGTSTINSYWLASRRYHYLSSYIFEFNGRYVLSSGSLSSYYLRDYDSSWIDDSNSFALRPIITLKSEIIKDGGSGTKENPYGLKESATNPDGSVTVYSESEASIGDSASDVYTIDPSLISKPFYFKYILRNNEVSESYLCYKVSETEYCLQGANPNAYADNISVMNTSLETECTSSTSQCEGAFGNYHVKADSSGNVSVSFMSSSGMMFGGYSWRIYSDGSSICIS